MKVHWWKVVFKKKCLECGEIMTRARTTTTAVERNMVWLCPKCCKCVVKVIPWWRKLFSKP